LFFISVTGDVENDINEKESLGFLQSSFALGITSLFYILIEFSELCLKWKSLYSRFQNESIEVQTDTQSLLK
jgi:hypothetical protein